MHKDCPEKGTASSKPACCNCQQAEGESARPANYRGCRHAKEMLRIKKAQATPKATGRVFSYDFTKPVLFLRNGAVGKKVVNLNTLGGRGRSEEFLADRNQTPEGNRSVSSGSQCKQSPLDNTFRVVSAVQPIMTELSDAVSEEDKILIRSKGF
jgi:hypothetical protein